MIKDPYFDPYTPEGFPWPNPNRAKPNNPWIPTVPFAPPYSPPGDRENRENDFQGLFKKLRGESEYFTKTKDSLKFRLELAGFAKGDISVEIVNQYLVIKSVNSQKPYKNHFYIPEAENYCLPNPDAKMENGLLEIFFTPKKEEVKFVKIL